MASRIAIRMIGMLAAPVLILNCGPALADAIDGNWCSADGRKLTINGPDIITPGGTHMKGDYDRHHFSYVMPASEPGGGGTRKVKKLDRGSKVFKWVGIIGRGLMSTARVRLALATP